MTEVNILGLCSPQVVAKTAEDFKGEIWSLNDWYRPYPWLPKIDRLYEVHKLDKVLEQQSRGGRYKGFKKPFENMGGKIIVDDVRFIEYLDADVELLRYDFLKNTYPLDFSCTIEIMIIEAIDKGFEKINLCGIFLLGGNHGQYIKGILKAIDYARGLGIEINTQHEDEWREYKSTVSYYDYINMIREA